MDDLRAALERSAQRHLEELRRLVRVPSVSAKSQAIDEAVEVCVELLEARGLDVRVHTTPGHPIVTASGGAQDAPTLLFYEHYDVQPVEPLDLWTVEPFDVTERDGCLYGRGTADTKGHIILRLAAIDACREVFGTDPIGYRFVIEGEEEIGSPNFEPFVADHADELRADGCLWEFGSVDADGRPTVTLGLKGVLSCELSVRVPERDLHSSLGVVVDNPLWRLCAAIASLRDADGRVLVDGFYDDVEPLSDAELAALRAEPDRTAELRKTAGVDRFLGGVEGAELTRRLAAEPCVNINGISGGYAGPGGKTVLPAVATAKLDVRLVPGQRPERVADLITSHLERHGFGDVELHVLAGEAAGRTPIDDPFVALVAAAARDAYGAEPVVHVSSAGSGPAYPFREYLRVPFASCGCAYPGSRAHAPDEHVRLGDYELGKLHTALVVARMAPRAAN